MSNKSLVIIASIFLVISASNNIARGENLDEEVEMLDSRNQMGPILFDQTQAPHLSMKEIESRLEPPAQKLREFFDPPIIKMEKILNSSNFESITSLTSKFLVDDLTSLALASKVRFSAYTDRQMESNRVPKIFNDELIREEIVNTLDILTLDNPLNKPAMLNDFLDDMTTVMLYQKAGFSPPSNAIVDTGFSDQTFLGKIGKALEKAAQSIESTNPYAPYYAWGP